MNRGATYIRPNSKDQFLLVLVGQDRTRQEVEKLIKRKRGRRRRCGGGGEEEKG